MRPETRANDKEKVREHYDRMSPYYHSLWGEHIHRGPSPGGPYKDGVPAHWLAYFQVTDCDATAAEAKNLGATEYMPPTDFEDVGRASVLADPQGAAFAIFKAAAQSASASGS